MNLAGNQLGVLAPQALPQDSRIVGYDKQLRMKAVLDDIWVNLQGVYNPEKSSIPDAVYMKAGADVVGQGLEAVITMLLPLSGGAVFGNNFAIGTEERPSTKTFRVYCNNFRKVVDTPGYGRRELEAAPYGLYEKHVDNLGLYNKEEEGLEIRQAITEDWGETLIYGDTAATCVRNFNPNIFCCGFGRYDDALVTYSTTRATYVNNIMTKVLAAGGGSLTPTNTQVLNQRNLSHLQNAAIFKRITPLKLKGLPGGTGWLVLVSELQAMYLGDPAWTSANLGSLWKDASKVDGGIAMKWTGVLGSWKKLLFVEEPRIPTLRPSGSSRPFGLTAHYVWPGDNDDRHRDETDIIDTFELLGANAVFSWTPEKLHHIQMVDDYGAIKGHGTALVRGIRIPIYDQQTPGAGTHEQFGSIMGLARLPNYV